MCFVSIVALILLTVIYLIRSRRHVIAFFHPHAASRGGGERVLWSGIAGLLNHGGKFDKIIVYSIDASCKSEILESVAKTFGITLNGSEKIEFRRVYFPKLLEPKTWPVATLLGQSIGSVICCLGSILATSPWDWPNVFIDTTGCPFTLPLARIFFATRVVAYVHYPTMSRDMFSKVRQRTVDFNNKAIFAKNEVLTFLKLMYYHLFLFLYRICGLFATVVMCNSNWTAQRMAHVWRAPSVVVYPPANISHATNDTAIYEREDAIVSLAQFRPEKNHAMQIRIFAKILCKFPKTVFWIMGGSRNAEDEALILGLKELALSLGGGRIAFCVNADRAEIESKLRTAKCAIHTMKDEHFGISLLEFLEAKIPIVAHRSGGPEADILMPDESFGFLASSETEFADKVINVLENFDSAEISKIRNNGYNSLSRFLNDDQFGRVFALHSIGR